VLDINFNFPTSTGDSVIKRWAGVLNSLSQGTDQSVIVTDGNFINEHDIVLTNSNHYRNAGFIVFK